MSRYRDTFALPDSTPSESLPTKPSTKARVPATANAKAITKTKRIRRYELPSHLSGALLREPGYAPYLYQVITDRLAFILPYGKSTNVFQHEKALRRTARRIAEALETEACERQYVKSPRYRHNISLPLPSNSKRAVFIQIEALQASRQRGDIRIDLNPARMTAEDIAYFHEFMRRIIGKCEYRELMAQPFINVWHPAADIEHLYLDHCLVTVSKVEHRTAIGKLLVADGTWDVDETIGSISGAVTSRRTNITGLIETYNFGMQNSDYFTCVYSKNIEAVHRAVEAIALAGRLAKKPLLEKAVRQLIRAKDAPSRVRVEVRGRKMRGVPLWALEQIGNRFEKIHFVDLADPERAPNIPASMRAACIAIYRDSGRNAVYAAFDGHKYLREIQRWLDGSGDPAWWKPELYWQEAIADLRRKKLFPPEAWDAAGQALPPAKSKRKSKTKTGAKTRLAR
ncbi:hypothetical protein [Variovorax sp. PCZ-1]|uniref:hypothetical protein n=1 Tax=Variovorax sp. PCZ-1 TaxID=2835533 RepID=UPI001BCB5427|nr:hypothetical protein [Variovorax sp. PCZ-1]MBS7809250.1 hypothetical protein [Variovorax sp. PCZ-1]